MTKTKFQLRNREITTPLTGMGRYRLNYTILLSLVPLACGLLLLLLLSVFSKLNLYFLESNGLMLDTQIRAAYFSQVQLVVLDVIWFLALQSCIGAVASYVIIKWSNAPFLNAEKLIRTALDKPHELKPQSKWLSESFLLDRYVWQFALRVKNGGPNLLSNDKTPEPSINIIYFIKFFIAFSFISIAMGYTMGIIISNVYDKIVSIALQFVKNTNVIGHYFVAQEDVLTDATYMCMALSIFIYLILGIQISRHMSTMTFVFTRAIRDEKFPISLRKNDIYGKLADTMNEAYARISKG